MLLCSLQEDGPAASPGSTTDHCVRCRRAVWVAPTSRLRALVVPPHCLACAAAVQRESGGKLTVFPPDADQMREIRRQGITAPAEELQRQAHEMIMRKVNES